DAVAVSFWLVFSRLHPSRTALTKRSCVTNPRDFGISFESVPVLPLVNCSCESVAIVVCILERRRSKDGACRCGLHSIQQRPAEIPMPGVLTRGCPGIFQWFVLKSVSRQSQSFPEVEQSRAVG